MLNSRFKSYSRSSRILNLTKTCSEILDNESTVPDSPVRLDESDLRQLENLINIDDEISSDRNLSQEGLDLDIFSHLQVSTDDINGNDDSFIADSNQATPMPSPSQPNFDDRSSPQLLETVVSRTVLETPSPAPIASVNSLVTISECDSPSYTAPKKRKSTFKKNPGKKRKRCEISWIDKRRKMLLNSGQKYVSRNGKERNKKELRPICPNTCKLRCYEKFNTNVRQDIHTNFWNLGDHTRQWEYINNFTKKQNKKSCTIEGSSRRAYTTKYFLPLPTQNDFNREQVCLKTFLNTLSISDQFVRTAQSKLNLEGSTEPDNRGKHPNHLIKIDSSMVKSVCDHVVSFQPVESHYTRKDTSKLYLDSNLNMNKMFSLYKQWDQLNNYERQATTLRQYRDIVNENMNIEFFIPKKDLCDKCHSYNNETLPTEAQTEAYQKHIDGKNIARDFKNNDKKFAINSPNTVCATFDFQKILNSPHGDVGLFYYKRKLSIYNFTVFDLAEKEGFCYMWTECTAKRGANEVSSCLNLFLKDKIDQGMQTFLFWSDNCSGQNRNRVVYSMYMSFSKEYNVDITHRFLVPGHTQNEGDSVHALIEKESKHKLIYTPDQWYALVRWAKTSGKPYKVLEVAQDQVFDFKSLLENRNWKKDMNNEIIKWNSIKEISIRKSDPDCIFFKYDFKEDYRCLQTLLRTRTRGRKGNYFDLENAYPDILPVTEAKFKDLISLCDCGVIPREYHRTYTELKHNANV